MVSNQCRLCDRKFTTVIHGKEYCSTACRRVHWAIRVLLASRENPKVEVSNVEEVGRELDDVVQEVFHLTDSFPFQIQWLKDDAEAIKLAALGRGVTPEQLLREALDESVAQWRVEASP